MAGRWNSTTGLDEPSERIEQVLGKELATGDFPCLSIEMEPVDAWDRNPMFTMKGPKGEFQGTINEVSAALEFEEELRKTVRAHLIAARDGD